MVIVDAAAGVVTTQPTAEELERAQQPRRRPRVGGDPRRSPPARSADGTPVPLLANLGKPEGAVEAVALGAEGVGLFRTEFLFLSANQAPTVEQQRESYTQLLAAFPGKKVVVRVLDAGADKPLAFLNDAHEENPALGLRGIRALRASEDILREQLTALAEADAATDADLWVMAPMVATVEETEYFTAIARDYGIKTAGVMVEVPSSALLADRILVDADFASIGTNDLTQYTLAADRLLGSVASFQDPWHPAVLRLIREVGDAGRIHGKPVGICGEAAADPLLAVVLVGLGATSLSMAPTALADVRASLLQHSLDDARVIAEAALAANDAASAREAARAAATTQEAARAAAHPDQTEGDTAMTTASAPTAGRSKVRVGVQRFGTFLSGMIMPNIPALIAWGIFTAFFIEVGWTPNADLATIVGPFIHYLLPIIIAYTGGSIIYGIRGGVVASIAVMGAIAGSDFLIAQFNATLAEGESPLGQVHMFIGAMIMAPLAAYSMKWLDSLWEGKIKAGFEMLVNMFSAGIWGFVMAVVGFYPIAFLVNGLMQILSNAVTGS